MIEHSKVQVSTTLFRWLNEKTDLTTYQVDLVDGFVFMLRKIRKHQTIRLIRERELHPRFWRSHDRTFGYKRKKEKEAVKLLYQFYVDVAFAEDFVEGENELSLTGTGCDYLQYSREQQLELLFQYIW